MLLLSALLDHSWAGKKTRPNVYENDHQNYQSTYLDSDISENGESNLIYSIDNFNILMTFSTP